MTKARDLANIISGGFTASDIPNLDTAKITTGTMADARISESSVTQHASTFDDNKIQSNIALLGFKTAVNGSLAKYNLQDQIIDEYEDASGIDASASTNERLTSGVYDGTSSAAPTRTQDADATGTDGDYTWFKWTDTAATGSYSANAAETAEFLVVAGGGGGGGDGNTVGGGGGGAGGLRTSYGSTSGGGASAETDLSLGSGVTYTMTVGAGGSGHTSQTDNGSNGGTSSISGSDITDITTVGGGKAAHTQSNAGTSGGSGGGNSYTTATVAAGTANQGYAGGQGAESGGNQASGGGGGGAGSVGATGSANVAPNGGAGLNISITGSSVGYAGGGGTGTSWASGGTTSTATHGGGAGGTAYGNNTGGNATANTGGGGGGGSCVSTGASSGGNGGTGVVILRVLTNIITAGGNLTLQSTDTTASTANPDYADMVCLIENAEGTATLNTDIKGYISEDSGVTFTQGTLVDEGTWGTNKKIIAFHDLDISAQTGSAMCYKITTHNQSAGSKETKIHATSIGWR